MQDGQPVLESLAPRDRVAAAVLDPVRVGLALQIARVGFLEEDFEDGLAGQTTKLNVMIVVSKYLTGIMQHFTRRIESLRK